MGQDLLLHDAVAEDFGGVEEAKFLRGTAPGATAGTGDIGEDEAGGCSGGGGSLAGEIGGKGIIFFDAGDAEAVPEVVEDGVADVGDGNRHFGVQIVGEDGFSAAGGAGVPEGGGRGGGW